MYKRIYVEITNICNLNCSFCPPTKRCKKYMSINEFEIILNKIKGYTNHIYLHIKGEPFMHPDIDKIIALSNKYGFNVNITTNARLLKSKLTIINNSNIRQINISLHSFDDTNEIETLLYVIDEIKNTYISLRLWNNKDNKEVIDLLEKHYSKKIIFDKKRFTLTNNIFLDKDIEFLWPNMNMDVISTKGTCKALKDQMGILVDGSVVSCCLDNNGDNTLGNIFETSLESIINSNLYKEMLNGFKNNILVSELCKRCGYCTRFKKGDKNANYKGN